MKNFLAPLAAAIALALPSTALAGAVSGTKNYGKVIDINGSCTVATYVSSPTYDTGGRLGSWVATLQINKAAAGSTVTTAELTLEGSMDEVTWFPRAGMLTADMVNTTTLASVSTGGTTTHTWTAAAGQTVMGVLQQSTTPAGAHGAPATKWRWRLRFNGGNCVAGDRIQLWLGFAWY